MRDLWRTLHFLGGIALASLAFFLLILALVQTAHCEEVMPSAASDRLQLPALSSTAEPSAVTAGSACGEHTPCVGLEDLDGKSPNPVAPRDGEIGALDPSAPADLLAVQPLAQIWLGAQTTYAPGAQRKDVAVGQVSLIAGLGRWGVGLRLRTMGAVGQYRPDQPTTFAAAEAYAAAWRNLLALQGGIVAGPAAWAGYAIPLQDQDGQAPKLARACTAMAGLRLAGPTWRAEVGAGQYQQLSGLAVGMTAHVEMSPHSAWIVDFATGARGRYVAAVALVLRP